MRVREVGDSGLTLCPVLLYGASSSRFGEWPWMHVRARSTEEAAAV